MTDEVIEVTSDDVHYTLGFISVAINITYVDDEVGYNITVPSFCNLDGSEDLVDSILKYMIDEDMDSAQANLLVPVVRRQQKSSIVYTTALEGVPLSEHEWHYVIGDQPNYYADDEVVSLVTTVDKETEEILNHSPELHFDYKPPRLDG